MQPTLLALTVAVLLAVPTAPAHAQTQPQAQLQAQPPQGSTDATAFVYQGVLRQGGQPVTEPFTASFRLYPTPEGTDTPIGPELQELITPDDGGRFSVELDFGAVFDASDRYLQITLLDPSNGPTPLMPRTKITAAPLATYALAAPIPSLFQITDGRLTATDAQGNLELSVDSDDDGLTITSQNNNSKYTPAGVTATNDFNIHSAQGDMGLLTSIGNMNLTASQGNLSLDASSGHVSVNALSNIALKAGDQAQLTLDQAGIDLSAISTTIDSIIQTKILGTQINLHADAVLTLNSVITQITGGNVAIAGHQFFTGAATINGNLTVTGSAVKPGGGPWGVLSDARQKKNITPLTGSLPTLLSLRPVRFEYRDPSNPLYVPGVQTGFVAQEVRTVLPQWVDTAPDGTLLLTPRGFEAMVVDALQELDARHEAEIGALRRENKELRQRLDRLERLLDKGAN